MIENEPASNMDTTVHAELAAFDRLPAPIRKFLSECPYNISSENVLHWYEEAKKEHGPWATQIILDWQHRAVREIRSKEIREGRLPPCA